LFWRFESPDAGGTPGSDPNRAAGSTPPGDSFSPLPSECGCTDFPPSYLALCGLSCPLLPAETPGLPSGVWESRCSRLFARLWSEPSDSDWATAGLSSESFALSSKELPETVVLMSAEAEFTKKAQSAGPVKRSGAVNLSQFFARETMDGIGRFRFCQVSSSTEIKPETSNELDWML